MATQAASAVRSHWAAWSHEREGASQLASCRIDADNGDAGAASVDGKSVVSSRYVTPKYLHLK